METHIARKNKRRGNDAAIVHVLTDSATPTRPFDNTLRLVMVTPSAREVTGTSCIWVVRHWQMTSVAFRGGQATSRSLRRWPPQWNQSTFSSSSEDDDAVHRSITSLTICCEGLLQKFHRVVNMVRWRRSTAGQQDGLCSPSDVV